jgi:GT2 family glycosyltransferase
MRPELSVIIPAHNATRTLQACLTNLAQAACGLEVECILVDDGSIDDSAAIGMECGARVLKTGRQIGPAGARNLGVKEAQADILLFIDADVCVHKDTLQRVLQSFREDPAPDALIGSYDDAPAEPDFVSLYKNLMHHFVHQTGRTEASTFWSGCGAIRKQIFLEHSGFDESFAQASIEDIELGYRLHMAGRRMMLDPHIQVKHLKRWSLLELVKTDVMNRGIPWTELILRDGRMPNDLNVQLSQRVSVALVFLLLLTGAGAAIQFRDLFLLPLFGLLLVALGSYWLDAIVSRSKLGLAVATLATAAIAWRAWEQRMPSLFLAVVIAYVLPFLRHRYVRKTGRSYAGTLVFLLIGVGCVVATIFHMPLHPLTFIFFALLIAVVALNNSFYLFLATRRGRFFALAAIPFHLLYHCYNGISFLAGTLRYFWFKRVDKARPR